MRQTFVSSFAQPVQFLLKPISKAELSDAIAADIRINHSSDSVVMYSGMKAVIQRVG